MNTIEFNKHDVNIFINGTWQKYAGNISQGDTSKLQGYLNFAFDQREIEVNLHKATTPPFSSFLKTYMMVKISTNQIAKKKPTAKSISNIGNS